MSSVSGLLVPTEITSGGRMVRGGSGFKSAAKRQDGETIRTAWLSGGSGASCRRRWCAWLPTASVAKVRRARVVPTPWEAMEKA